MDELLAKFGATATDNRLESINQAAGDSVADMASQVEVQRRNENMGALGVALLLGAGWLGWTWLKKRRRRR
jgi:hypothetical protein